METCLLCLQEPRSFNSFIPINFETLYMIEKHFWPVGNQQSTLGVCCFCWTKLNEFHTFYEKIEEAHRTISKICNDEKFPNHIIDPLMVQIPIHIVCKPNNTSNEENVIVDDLDSDIKIENSYDEYENTLPRTSKTIEQAEDFIANSYFEYEKTLPEPSKTIEQDEDFLPRPIEKRKRGRPRKNNPVIKKPKGKRGRPRKILSNINVQHTNNSSYWAGSKTAIHNRTSTTEMETLSQSAFVSTIRNGTPPKKRGRGRPRKIQNNSEITGLDNKPNTSTIPDNVGSVKECFKLQSEKVMKLKTSNLKEKRVKLVNKNKKTSSMMKKRKALQQHKALMRNYIATSLRCMKFLQK